jgi:arsenate reductase-like glutaredoxin family protein
MDKKIVLYGLPSCSHCKIACMLLDKAKINYEYKTITNGDKTPVPYLIDEINRQWDDIGGVSEYISQFKRRVAQ